MKSICGLLVLCLVGLAASQRPFYAPNPVRYPDVAPRFRVSTSTEDGVQLGNRAGEDVTTERLPQDARGNVDVVNQIKSWPEDRRPFWYINAQHIENARNRPQPVQSGQSAQQPQPVQQLSLASRSSFLSK